jgi:hypothetical protein
MIAIPERLGGDAFIWDYVRPLLPVSGTSSEQTFQLKAIISDAYVKSYLDELAAYILTNLRVGNFYSGTTLSERQNIRRLRQVTSILGVSTALQTLSWTDILHIKNDPMFRVFSAHVRFLSSLPNVPVAVWKAITSRHQDLRAGSSRDHIIRAVGIIVEDLAPIDIYGLETARVLGPIARRKIVDWDLLLKNLLSISPGNEGATEHERSIERLLTALFDPILIDPEVQVRHHEGRKRVDITYRNMGNAGFFAWLSTHYRAPYICVECKNYSKDVGNPELDQLAGRFSPVRGEFGLLICRKIDNITSLLKNCADAAFDRRGFIVPLDDADLRALIEEVVRENTSFEFSVIKERFDRMVRRDL